MKIYQLKSSQILPVSLSEAWKFFSDPKNLSKITPNWLNFEITSSLPNRMYAGMIVSYKVRPILNIPQTWITEITHVDEPFYFVDEQRFGPYKMWHHEHIFTEIPDVGVEMQDLVTYMIPFGWLGRIANSLFVRKRVLEIFQYRKEVLNKMFGLSVNIEGKLEYFTL
ncbi:MAG: SRPBCC family protein [Ignavibacterium album]|uniref:SRPBCC family protein n=1 Tax=Ignavibacterium album TaxID=591197 RepID=UPI0026F2948B|nr:SRPBCC family protein [Ignavibacterium album]MCX8104818.1 SRPBCC family protein [Ignavibacterium album]